MVLRSLTPRTDLGPLDRTRWLRTCTMIPNKQNDQQQGTGRKTGKLTPLLSTWGFLISSQQGPMIFRLMTSSSNALVEVPNTQEMLALQAELGISGSMTG